MVGLVSLTTEDRLLLEYLVFKSSDTLSLWCFPSVVCLQCTPLSRLSHCNLTENLFIEMSFSISCIIVGTFSYPLIPYSPPPIVSLLCIFKTFTSDFFISFCNLVSNTPFVLRLQFLHRGP